MRVYDFQFNGNDQLVDAELRSSMKKIKRRYRKINIFVSSKFTREKFEEDKESLVKLYQSKGFRDARILSDSISLFNLEFNQNSMLKLVRNININ